MEVNGPGSQEMSQGGREARLIVLSPEAPCAFTGMITSPSSSPTLLASDRVSLLERDAAARTQLSEALPNACDEVYKTLTS